MRPLQLGRPGNILTPSDTIQTAVLTTVAQAFDVPTGAQYAGLSLSSGVAYVAYGSTAAAVPTTSSTGSGGSEVIPSAQAPYGPVMRDLHSTAKTTGISLLAPVAGAVMSISWYGP